MRKRVIFLASKYFEKFRYIVFSIKKGNIKHMSFLKLLFQFWAWSLLRFILTSSFLSVVAS